MCFEGELRVGIKPYFKSHFERIISAASKMDIVDPPPKFIISGKVIGLIVLIRSAIPAISSDMGKKFLISAPEDFKSIFCFEIASLHIWLTTKFQQSPRFLEGGPNTFANLKTVPSTVSEAVTSFSLSKCPFVYG